MMVLANEVEVQPLLTEPDVRERLLPLPSDRRTVRWRCTVSGCVQGVGFRPYVSGLARSLGVTGFVGNDAAGVFIEVQGDTAAIAAFAGRLKCCPAPAAVGAVRVEELPPRPETEFVIAASDEGGAGAILPPDLATCDDCLGDLLSPDDRRFGHPFVTCARCGPRFTLIRNLPFDRHRTAMDTFEMCPACAAEFRDPKDRRFHAQTVACPACGPRVWFTRRPGGEEAAGADAIEQARRALAAGKIVAVKGVGGFHLACDAANDATVRRLRDGKERGDKPFALMAPSVEVVREYAELSPDEERVLTGPERPIVLLSRRKTDARPLSPAVAPASPCLGFMLPYAPLHHLLVADQPLVMTSGNAGGEAIITANVEARSLTPPADAFLLHDREIVSPCDDSVVRVFEGELYPIRRSRGYAPQPVPLRKGGPSVLAAGGELKAAFCLAVGERAFLSQHVGDVGNPATLAAFERAVQHLTRLLRAEPVAVACDAHPNYLSVRWAEAFTRERGLRIVRVQHHRAHVAGLAAEHLHEGPLIGVCFDGTGCGDDGAIWGGEVFAGELGSLARVAHLDYVPLPGGDAAVERPYRMALAHLWAAGLPWDESLPCVRACPAAERKILQAQFARNVNCVPTSSAGRLFDAVAALSGGRQTVTYEAQAAIELEAVSVETPDGYVIPLIPGEPLRLDPRPLIRQVARDLSEGMPVAVIAGRFHRGLAEAIAQVCRRVRDRTGVNAVGLTGGVFQNVLLLRLAIEALRRAGFSVLVHRQVPANDGGMSLGQAVLARAALDAS